MKKENNNLSYKYTQNSIEDISKLISGHDDSEKHIEQLQNIDKYISAQRKFTKVVLFASLLISTALLFVLIKTGVSNNELFNMNKNLIDKHYDSISDVILGVKKDVNKSINEVSKINYRVRKDESIVTYPDLLRENDSLDSVNYIKDGRINQLKGHLSMIKGTYGVVVKETVKYKNDSVRTIYREAVSPKIDSALILYDLYKNNLKYDKKSKSWIANCE